MIMAGYETTSSALAWAERLLRSPEVMGRLRDDLAQGAMNIWTPSSRRSFDCARSSGGRSEGAREDVALNGHLIPRRLGPDGLALPTPPRFGPPLEPDEFRPDRFLDGGDGEPWQPFGGGVRRCLGASFAQLEMKVVIRAVLAAATLSAPDHANEPIVRKRFTFAPAL
jgi:cytochrome P450